MAFGTGISAALCAQSQQSAMNAIQGLSGIGQQLGQASLQGHRCTAGYAYYNHQTMQMERNVPLIRETKEKTAIQELQAEVDEWLKDIK